MIDTSQLNSMITKLQTAQRELKPFMGKRLNDAGEEFLDIVQAEIMRAGNVDTRLLLSSFSKGSGNGIYELDTGGLTLTIGTTVKYAAWVNKGHPQRPGRFVPGVWSGSRFTYIPGAKTGMVLKASFVKGSYYFDKSVDVLEKMFPQAAERMFAEFFQKYFS